MTSGPADTAEPTVVPNLQNSANNTLGVASAAGEMPALDRGNLSSGFYIEDVPREQNAQLGLNFKASDDRAEGAEAFLKYAVPGTVLGFADTVLNSLGIVDQHGVEDSLNKMWPQFGDYYSRNKEALQTAGDITGMFIPGMAATKLIQGGGMLAKALKYDSAAGSVGNSALSYLFTTGLESDALMANAAQKITSIASKSGVQEFTTDMAVKAIKSEVAWTKVGDAVKNTVAFEAGVAATMHSSETLYPADNTFVDYALLNLGFGGAIVGAEYLVAKRAVNRMINRAAEFGYEARHPGDFPLGEVLSQPENRDVMLTTYALERSTSTNLMNSTALTPGMTNAEATTLRTNLNRDIGGYDKVLDKIVGELGNDRFDRELASRINVTEGQKRNAIETLKNDPLALIGALSIEHPPANFADALHIDQQFADRITGLRLEAEDAYGKAIKHPDGSKRRLAAIGEGDELHQKANAFSKLTSDVIEIDGSITPTNMRRPKFTDNPVGIGKTPGTLVETGKWGFKADIRNPNTGAVLPTIQFGEDGLFTGTGAGEVEKFFRNADSYDYSAAWALVRRSLNDLDGGLPKFPINLKADSNFITFDYVNELMLRTKDKEGLMKLISVPEGMKLSDIPSMAMNAKFDAFLDAWGQIEKNATAAGKAADVKKLQGMNIYDLQTMLNLPGLTNPMAGVHPVLESMIQAGAIQGDKILIKKGPEGAFSSFADFQRQIQETFNFPMPTTFDPQSNIKMVGNMLQLDDTRSAFMVTRKPISPENWTRDGLENTAAMFRGTVISQLRSQDGTLVKAIADDVLKSGAFGEAQNVASLANGGQRGSGIFGQFNFTVQGSPALEAANDLVSANERLATRLIKERFSPHLGTFNTLRAKANAGDLLQFNQYVQANRLGFEFAKDPIAGPAGGMMFPLRNTEKNRTKWAEVFHTDMPEEAFLPQIGGQFAGQPLVLLDNAFNAAKAISDLGAQHYADISQLRQATGRGPIQFRDWWVPPENFTGKHVNYILNPTGETKRVIAASTPAELEKKTAQELAQYSEEAQKTLLVVDQARMRQHWDIQDEHFAGLINYADSAIQTGGRTGAAGSYTIPVGVDNMNGIVDSLQSQMFNSVRRTRALLFEPQLNQVRQMHEASGLTRNSKENSIWQMYQTTIYGGQLQNPTTNVGMVYKPLESIYDRAVQAVSDYKNGRNTLGEATRGERAEYNAIQKQLGDWSPFTTLTDYVETTFNIKTPPSLKQHGQALNNMMSLLSLRFMDVANALVNGVSLAANMPAVIKGLQKLPQETTAEFGRRVGWYGSPLADNFAQFSAGRALVSGAHFRYTNEGRAVIARAAEQGLVEASGAEITQALTASQHGYYGNLLKMWNEKAFSRISDRSETLSREIAFATGYNIFKRAGDMTNEKDLMLAAGKFADQVLGNYNPRNRPQIFQGAVGTPLGLFQTFTWNYMQRLLNYVEDGQHKALATQFGLQAFTFGGSTLPGYNQFTQYFASGHNGRDNPIDGMRKRYGEDFTDLLTYGTLANIPKLWGSHNGFAISSRGDVNLPHIPTLMSLEDTPIYSLAKNVGNATRDTINSVQVNGGFSPQRMLEILGTYTPNRPIARLAELASGYSVDRQGQVISNDINNGISIASRVVGLRSLAEQKSSEELSRLRAVNAAEQSKLEAFSKAFRASIRGDEVNGERLANSLRFAFNNGMNPGTIARVLRNEITTSLVSKGDRDLMKPLTDPNKAGDAVKLVNSGVGRHIGNTATAE